MMYKLLKNLFLLLCASMLFTSCRKEALDNYYGRPENLGPPIYQTLESKGNFKTLLAVIDKSGYKNTLSAAGYWTFFAPNDAAFQKYFTDNNTSIDRIDSVTARKIVTYCLVYNAFQTNHIADFQSSTQPVGWVANSAYKRRTAYYDSFYTGTGPDGPNNTLLSSNFNGGYILGDNNNKYIPYFYSTYMAARGLTEADYKYFFPNATYSNFNVVDARVVNTNILAENGVIHEIDRVVLPLPNIEDMVIKNNQYSLFKRILDKFVGYINSPELNARYRLLTGKSDIVYVKAYSSTLAYSLNNESFLKIQANDAQTEGYSLFAPTNDVLYKYLNDVVLEFFKNTPTDQLTNAQIDALINTIPPGILTDLLNAHMFQATAWPSKFASVTNFLNEPARFNSASDIIQKQFCSNGLFYGANKVQATNVFSTVYSRAYLDPKNYSIMTLLLNQGLRIALINPGIRYTVFMMPDAALRAAGYNYDAALLTWSYTVNGATITGNGVRDQLLRILQSSIVATQNNELNDLSGSGIAETFNGEYIRWNNNTVSSGGTVESNTILNVVGSKDYSNGKVYYLGNNGLLTYPVKTIPQQIAVNATATTSPYYNFYRYLTGSQIYNAQTQDITGLTLGANYTVLIPTNEAIVQAVRDGALPGTPATGVPNFAPASSADKDLVARFIYYHIISGIQIAPDGKKSPNGTAQPTMLKNANGDVVNVIVFNQPNNMRLVDVNNRQAIVLPPNNSSYFPATSNYLGTRTLFHQIDNYLKFTY